LAIPAWLVAIGPPVAAQATGTLGIGASIVEYDGFLSSKAAVFVPALRFDSPRFSIGGQASWTVFESGHRVIESSLGAAWFTAARSWWRVELGGTVGGSWYEAEPGWGHLLGAGRFHFFGERAGGWVGLTSGTLFGGPSVVPVEVSAGGWTVSRRLALIGTLTATWVGRARHIDALGTIRWTGDRVEVEGKLGARPWVRSPGQVGDAATGGYAELTTLVPLDRRLILSFGGGTYPSDPVRRVLGAKYLNAGVRLVAFGRAATPIPLAVNTRLRERVDPSSPNARIEVGGSEEDRVIRVHAPGSSSVELMADFTDWSPTRLSETKPGVWEARLAIPPGVYRINLRINGGSWSVPRGTRVEQNEYGGTVGILVVP
jgi:hypothetical protein